MKNCHFNYLLVVYDMKNYELPVAIFDNYVALAKFFNTTPANSKCDVCKKTLKKGRYLIEKVKI